MHHRKRPTERSARRRAFTLIELMLVVMLMAFLGSFALSGYRTLQRGIAERGAMENVNMFLRVAYQRCQMDRLPVQVCFWNETVADETDDAPATVIGRAVAVRRAGRLTSIDTAGGKKVLCDEFGDLETMRYVDEEGEKNDDMAEQHVKSDGDGANATYLYRVSGKAKVERSLVSQISLRIERDEPLLSDGSTRSLRTYGYGVIDDDSCSDWKVGDAYGLVISEFSLPPGFIFGGEGSYSKNCSHPIAGEKAFVYTPDAAASGNIDVYEIRMQDSGSFSASKVSAITQPNIEGGVN